MLFADVTFSTEGIAIIGGLCAVLVSAIIALFATIKVLFNMFVARLDAQLAAKDKEVKADKLLAELKEHEAMEKTLQEMADEAIKSAIESDNKRRKREGRPMLKVPKDVVPEGSSPPTDKQRMDAWIATRRATMVRLKDEAEQEPRHEPGSPEEKERQAKEPGEGEGEEDESAVSSVPLVEVLDKIKSDAEAIVEKARIAADLAADKERLRNSEVPAMAKVETPNHPPEDKYP